MQPHDIEGIISGARDGGWDFFNGAPDQVKAALDVDQSRAAEDAAAISSAWARFYKSRDGRKALEKLFDTTLRRTVFFAALGLDLNSMAVFGAMREGQNALAHEIARQIGLGLQEAVKPRDV